MSAWPLVPIKDVARIVGGSTPKSGTAEFWDGQIPWATPKDLSDLDGKFIDDTPRKISQSGLNSCSSELLPPNSVLFSSRAPIGHVAINTVPMATNQGFKSFVPKPKIDPSYLYWWLKSHRSYLERLGNGATFKEVSKAVVERIEIPLPPLEEQKRIAAILDQADDIRRKRQHAIDRLNQLGQAIFYEMFGDPVSNTKGWNKVKFRDIVADETGGNIKTLQSDYLSSGNYPIVDQGQEKIGGYTNEADRVCKAELPVIVFGDHTKCFKFIDFPFCLGADGTKILKSKGQVDDLYLFYAIQKIHIPDAGYSRHFKYLKDGEISLPDLQHQRQFSNLIREIEGRINKMVLGNSASESLFASLQHRAFTGQL